MSTLRRLGSQFQIALLLVIAAGCGTAYLEPQLAGPDYALQGEYASADAPVAAQVIARGRGVFELVVFEGGLPGAGWNADPPMRMTGARGGDGTVRFQLDAGALDAHLRQGSLRLLGLNGRSDGSGIDVGRIERHSPTEAAVAPPGAVVVFAEATETSAGINATDGGVDARGWLAAGAESDDSFGSALIHLEFQTPFMPNSFGQARGNSGVYLQGRYEVQVLDSFGLDPASNDSAGIYEVSVPLLNMSFPPLQWQTYDIEFEAAVFSADGRKTAPASVSVRHNGVLVQDRVAVPAPTGLGDSEAPTPGRLLLQNHLNPVYYRNVWVLPR
jgi:hypothetical protein